MEQQKPSLRRVWSEQWSQLRSLPFKPVFILISVTVVQIVARFHTSRPAFRRMFGEIVIHDGNAEMYEYCYWLLGDFVLQFPLILLFIRLVLKESPKTYGIGIGDSRAGIRIALLSWLCMVPILWIASADHAFLAVHPAPGPAKIDWTMFVVYEACSILYIVGWEFIWRGYMLFGLKEHVGYHAVLIQAIPFTLLHFGSPQIETFGALVAGVGLGMLALATRSFWYGAAAHMSILGTMDLFGSMRVRAGTTGVGLTDLLETLRKGF